MTWRKSKVGEGERLKGGSKRRRDVYLMQVKHFLTLSLPAVDTAQMLHVCPFRVRKPCVTLKFLFLLKIVRAPQQIQLMLGTLISVSYK